MMKNGSEAGSAPWVLASQKEKMEGANATLKCHLRRDEKRGGTEVPLPIGTDTLVSENNKPSLPRKYTHLPHIDLEGYYQFVTFRTFDSVDEFVRKWDFSPAMSNKEKQQKIDEYLDTSINGAYLKDDILKYLFDFLISNDKRLYELVAFCIMNNHVHILFKPLESLSKVMQMIKGVSAKKINGLLCQKGKFWADDYYDKAIRDEKHFWVVYEYIKNNPLKIGEINNSEANTQGADPASLPRYYGAFEGLP
jgi:putative transposase